MARVTVAWQITEPPRRSRRGLLIVSLVVLIAALVFVSWFTGRDRDPATTTSGDRAQQFATSYGGNVASYRAIFGLTDCDELKRHFDIAYANFDAAETATPQSAAAIGFMKAADTRMGEVGCY